MTQGKKIEYWKSHSSLFQHVTWPSERCLSKTADFEPERSGKTFTFYLEVEINPLRGRDVWKDGMLSRKEALALAKREDT